MTGWSISARCFSALPPDRMACICCRRRAELLDPGIAMGLAMLGVFVGLSFNPRRRPTAGSVAASLVRTGTVMIPVAMSVFPTLLYRTNADPVVGPAGCSRRLRGSVGIGDRRKRR